MKSTLPKCKDRCKPKIPYNLKIFILLLTVIFTVGIPPLKAQQVSVSGNVTDPSGESVPGVNILEKGTSNGTVSDLDGNYEITLTERRSIGEIRNQGLEVSLNWQDDVKGDFSYYMGGNLTTLENTVLGLGGADGLDAGSAEFRQRSIIGQPFQAFFGYQTDGIFQTEEEINNSGYSPEFIADNDLQPGDLIFRDQNGDQVINDEDRVILGTFLPSFTYGFNAGITYKNFDLSALVQGQSGYKILNRKRGEIIFTNDTNLDADLATNLWRGAGTSNQYPSAAGLRKSWNQNLSDYFVEDGSYFRIQNVRLTYALENSDLFGITIPRTAITLTAERPLTLFNYNGFNPEVANGIDRQVYPIPAIYTVGLNIKL
ncbi:MAG: carboxypeptidase-like regulatory domain-containing protein [Cyclobacteriaceae bacterium]